MQSIHQNPYNAIDPELAAVLIAQYEKQEADLVQQNAIIAASRPSVAEKAAKPGPFDHDPALKASLTEAAQARSDAVLSAIKVRIGEWDPFVTYTAGGTGTVDQPIDHSFWYAEAWVNGPNNMRFDWRPDGLHITGGYTHHSGDFFASSFGVTVRYGLSAERIPFSASGRWQSSAPIELFGGVRGYTGNSDFTTGDLWAKCWLHQRHTIFQFGFGPTGPVPLIRGNGESHEVLIFEENMDRPVWVPMPGFRLMPTALVTGVNTADTLWADVDLRFDVQLEGHGSLIWPDPDIHFRGNQWPLIPI